ncbi:MAG TPA: HEAT repeat domain-containing protein [Terriglobales bacterium]|nr:HEAT repeat domain-containing protein [Terriglobales bacterium]
MKLNTLQQLPSYDWPEGVEEYLLEILQNPDADPEDLLIAADLAAEPVAMSEPLAQVLLAIVTDDNRPLELRAEALSAFGPVLELADIDDFTDPEEVPIAEATFDRVRQLVRQIHDDSKQPDMLRRRALEVSVRAPESWHAEAVRAAYGRKDDEWQLSAVFCMSYISGFDGEIVANLRSKNPAIRFEAVQAAGNLGVEAAFAEVLSLARSSRTEKDLRVAAIMAAGWINAAEAAVVLGELYESDPEIGAAIDEVMTLATMESGIDGDEDDEGN